MVNYITKKTYKNVESELSKLAGQFSSLQKEVTNALARGDGTHDNAPYDIALANQRSADLKFEVLEKAINSPVFIDDIEISLDKVGVGCEVKVKSLSNDSAKSYLILGPADVKYGDWSNVISYSSPLAKSIIGSKVGDEVLVVAPDNKYKVRIIEINYIKGLGKNRT